MRAELAADRPEWMGEGGADGWCMPAMNPDWDQATAYHEPTPERKDKQITQNRPTTTTAAPTTTTTLAPTTLAPTADGRICMGAHQECQRVNQGIHASDIDYSKHHCKILGDAGYGCHWDYRMEWGDCEHTTCKITQATYVNGVSAPSFVKVLHPPCPQNQCNSKDHHHNGGGSHHCAYDAKEFKCRCKCARRVEGPSADCRPWCAKEMAKGANQFKLACTWEKCKGCASCAGGQ